MNNTLFTLDYQNVNSLFGRDITYKIPAYQRPYMWDSQDNPDENQVIVLWNDFIKYFQVDNIYDSEKTNPYFFGSIVLNGNISEGIFEVIDGQQRITTLAILFSSIKCFLEFIKSNKNYTDEDSEKIINFITRSKTRIDDIIFNEKILDTQKPIIQKKIEIEGINGFIFNYDRILQIVMECGNKSNIPFNPLTKEQISVTDRYFRNREFFDLNLKKLFLSTEGLFTLEKLTKLNEFIEFLQKKIIFIRIIVENYKTAQQIFEVINSRGLQLSTKDLLRNHIIKEFFELRKNENIANSKWFDLDNNYELDENFIYCWIESKIGEKRSYSAFNDILQIYKENYKSDIEQFYNSFKIDLNYYISIVNATITNVLLKNKILFLIHHEYGSIIKSLLLALFRNCSANGNGHAKILSFVNLFEKYIIHRLLAKSERFSSDLLYKVCKLLNENEFEIAANEFLLSKNETEELKQLIAGDIRNNDHAKLLISKFVWSNIVAQDVYEFQLFYKKCTLEHIIPQNPTLNSNWQSEFTDIQRSQLVYKLGNMTLLTRELNSEVKNYDWNIKKESYKNTTLFITRELLAVLNGINPHYNFFINRHDSIVNKIYEDLELKPTTIKFDDKKIEIKQIKVNNNVDYKGMLDKVEALDKVNYFGLINGAQIMFCTSRVSEHPLYLWCLDKFPKHKMSPEGFDYFNKQHFNNQSQFIAEIELIKLRSNKLEMWKELYHEKLFPFWEPTGGPYEFNLKKLNSIALCRVYKTDFIIEPNDISSAPYSKRTLINANKIKSINEQFKNSEPILLKEIYDELENKIKSIIDKYK